VDAASVVVGPAFVDDAHAQSRSTALETNHRLEMRMSQP
jgi:hypothetical protein